MPDWPGVTILCNYTPFAARESVLSNVCVRSQLDDCSEAYPRCRIIEDCFYHPLNKASWSSLGDPSKELNRIVTSKGYV